MNKIFAIIALVGFTVTAQAEDTCKKNLEDMALAAFDATQFRDPEHLVIAEADMEPLYKKVTLSQFKGKYELTYQLKYNDVDRCEVVGATEIKEVLEESQK